MAIASRKFGERYSVTISRAVRSLRSPRWPTPTQRSRFKATPLSEASKEAAVTVRSRRRRTPPGRQGCRGGAQKPWQPPRWPCPSEGDAFVPNLTGLGELVEDGGRSNHDVPRLSPGDPRAYLRRRGKRDLHGVTRSFLERHRGGPQSRFDGARA